MVVRHWFSRRNCIIAITITSPLIVFLIIAIHLQIMLYSAYGPGGILDRERRRFSEAIHAEKALREGRFSEAVERYQTAIASGARSKNGDGEEHYIRLHLADALTGLGRYAEAEVLYRKELTDLERAQSWDDHASQRRLGDCIGPRALFSLDATVFPA